MLAILAIAFFALPFIGLVWRTPWSTTWEVLKRPAGPPGPVAVDRVLAVGHGSVDPSSACRWPGCWRASTSPGRGFVRALATLSMVLPPVVGGVALFFSFGRRGLFGQYLYDWWGFRLPFTTRGVIVAQTFVAMPFLVLTMEGALRQLDIRFEDAARTLGASRGYVFRRVTLPAVRPAFVAGAVLAWARALGEFGATITFAGNFPGTTQTMPLAIYLALESNPDEALVLSMVLIGVSFAVLIGLRDRWLGGRPAPR